VRYKVEIEVEQEEIVMEQKIKFGLGFGRLAILEKNRKDFLKFSFAPKNERKYFYFCRGL
jgi:hypothetical protein